MILLFSLSLPSLFCIPKSIPSVRYSSSAEQGFGDVRVFIGLETVESSVVVRKIYGFDVFVIHTDP